MILLGIRAFKFSNSHVNNSWIDIKKQFSREYHVVSNKPVFCNGKQTGQAPKGILHNLIGNGNAVLSVKLSSSLSLKENVGSVVRSRLFARLFGDTNKYFG